MSQFKNIRNQVKNYKNIAVGIFIFSIGLFKKVVIADSFTMWVNNGFDAIETLTFLEAWITSLSYTFQIYFDFSAYTDMAIGIALLFNIKLPINFNSPYKAITIQDFWRRWHITLSRFLKDYIYIPLGGNRNGEFKTYINLFTTFFLAGIWHGASWTFVVWGIMHGFALIIHRVWQKYGFRMPILLAWFITFNFINISWVFFRANTFDDAFKVLGGMVNYSFDFSLWLQSINENISSLLQLILSLAIVLLLKTTTEYAKSYKPTIKILIFTVFIIVLNMIFLNQKSSFLYFNF